MPSVTSREFNPTTGAFVGNISSLSFGRTIVGTHTPVKVIDFAFSGVSVVSNVKIGLLDSGGLEVNPDPQDIDADGSAGNGYFGLMHSLTFDVSTAASALTRHFSGLNTLGTAADTHNIILGTKTNTVSQFVYMDIEIGANDLGSIAGLYKVFFDFEE